MGEQIDAMLLEEARQVSVRMCAYLSSNNRHFPSAPAGDHRRVQGPVYRVNDVAHSSVLMRIGLGRGALAPGQAVPIHLDAMPGEPMDGVVRRIFPTADRSSRLLTVEVALPGDANERGVRPGFLARVRMPIDERPDVLGVPASAIGEDGGDRHVFVINDDRLHRRVIEVGATRGQWTEVIDGLEAGEVVLATNPIDMSDGPAVRIVGWRG